VGAQVVQYEAEVQDRLHRAGHGASPDPSVFVGR
jgi:hypothetical protein